MSQLHLIIFDNLNNVKEKKLINKPRTLKELLQYLGNKNNLYELFVQDNNNNKIIINNEDKYRIIKNIIFIKEIDPPNHSLFSINYNKLSDSKKEILDEKYNCNICSIIIKNESPYLCYKCQKIFHERCLKEWDKQCKSHNKILECPICRNKLPLEKWNKKLHFEENRLDNANLLNKINEYKLNNNMNNNINLIKIPKIKIYEDFINQIIMIFKNILNKIGIIHNKMKIKNNNKLNDIINYEISKVINEELDYINENIYNNKINNITKPNYMLNEYKNEINLKYYVNNKSMCKIFGDNFINHNKNNIELKINGKNNPLVREYELKSGENVITLLIKNQLTYLNSMFSDCKNLKDISELKYLNVNEVNDFSYIFFGCSSLSDIKPLQFWNVSKAYDFSGMFYECSSLSDINPLQNWNVSNCKNFSSMFYGCNSLSDIKPLQNWNVLKSSNFRCMFYECKSLVDIKPLQNWNVANCTVFKSMFQGCESLADIKPLQNWNVSNGKDFSNMFSYCNSLSDIKPLQNWNVSKGEKFWMMFSGCFSLKDNKPLQHWKYFKDMFDTNKYY